MPKLLFLTLTIIHALIHTLGFLKSFNLAKVEQLLIPISRPLGALWLLSFMLLSLSATLIAISKNWWGIVAIPAVILSQFLIILSWSDAKFGTIPNIIIFLVALVSIGSFLLQYRFENVVKTDFEQNNSITTEILDESDMVHLPAAVQNYLRYTKSIGKPQVKNFRAEFTGGMRSNPEDEYMKFNSTQYNFYQQPARYFYMSASKMGLPASGLHIYQNQIATFDVKMLNWIPVVSAKGELLDQAETVTLFNDMCLIAPPTLIDKRISWQELDPLTVKAVYTNDKHTITATLYFNQQGEMINFISNDRYHTDGKNYENYPWQTPVSDYKEINGYLLPSKAKLIYQKPTGDFTYGELVYKDVKYNMDKQLPLTL